MTQSLKERAAGWGERGAETVQSSLEYLPGEPVRVVVRKRSIRYDIGDDGGAIALAGKPRGWREVAERLCAEEGMNLARDGRVWVAVTQGRDLDALAARIAELSAEVYDAVLDLEG
jgi:hypothetical protein